MKTIIKALCALLITATIGTTQGNETATSTLSTVISTLSTPIIGLATVAGKAGKVASFATKTAIVLAAATCVYGYLTPNFLQTPINKAVADGYEKISKECGDIIPSSKQITDSIIGSFNSLENFIKTVKKTGNSIKNTSLTMAKNTFCGLAPLGIAYLALKYLP